MRPIHFFCTALVILLYSPVQAEDYYSAYYLTVEIDAETGSRLAYAVVPGFPEDSAGNEAYVIGKLISGARGGMLTLYGIRFRYHPEGSGLGPEGEYILMEPFQVEVAHLKKMRLVEAERRSALQHIAGTYTAVDSAWLRTPVVAMHVYSGYLMDLMVWVHTPDQAAQKILQKLDVWQKAAQEREREAGEREDLNLDALDEELHELGTPLEGIRGVVAQWCVSD